MSERSYVVCDGCGNRSDDFYDEAGWLHIISTKGLLRVVLTEGRDAKRVPKVKVIEQLQLHFCSYDCVKLFTRKKRK